MKIMINYDFVEALRNVNEPFGPMKVVRNNIYQHLKINYPLVFAFDTIYCTLGNRLDILPVMLGVNVLITEGIPIASAYMANKVVGGDLYKKMSELKLAKLVSEFNNNYISTDYYLLLQSEYYDHIMEVNTSDNKMPVIVSKKYVLVPTYTYSKDVEDTSIEQEHVLGTNDYVLSVGTPKKARKLVLAKSNV